MIDDLIESIKPYNLKIDTIIDIGTRDMEQSIEFHSVYPEAKIYAIEANKESYEECLNRKPDYINLLHFAALDYDGETDFYEIAQTDNKGGSSIFEPTQHMVGCDSLNGLKHVKVPCKRIDTVIKERIDLAWADVQGCEIPTLKGFGDLLKDVKVIATEAETGLLYYPSRKYEPTKYEELKNYLIENGFKEIYYHQPWPRECDVVYINERFI